LSNASNTLRENDAQPFHRADPFRPAASTVRSCQTLGHASNLIMRTSLLFVAAPAPSRKKKFAAGASPPKRCASSGMVLCRRRSSEPYPAFAESPRWRRIESKQGRHVPLAALPSGHKAKIQVGLAQSRPSSSDPTHSPSPKVQGHFRRRSCGSPCQP
jgi:hypothetical protein